MKNFYQKGITLLEVIIVIAIVGILVAIVSPQFSKMKNSQIIKNASSDIVSSLNKAQSQTRASLDSFSYGVHFQSDKIIIFKGINFSANDANNQNINIISPATISNITLTNGATSIYFNRLTGLPSGTGMITVSISSDASLTKIITISATGLGSIN